MPKSSSTSGKLSEMEQQQRRNALKHRHQRALPTGPYGGRATPRSSSSFGPGYVGSGGGSYTTPVGHSSASQSRITSGSGGGVMRGLGTGDFSCPV